MNNMKIILCRSYKKARGNFYIMLKNLNDIDKI